MEAKNPEKISRHLRWGILGTGAIARDIARSFAYVENADLVAVASRNHSSAHAFAKQFNIENAYSSYDELLEDPDIDVVHVATPHHRHKQDSLNCLEHGKAVLCEKPFTMNAREAEEVIQLAREKGLFCMEGMWMRFIPLINDIKNRIENKEIGDIQFLHADFGYPTPFNPESRFFSLKQGGGSLLDRGVYTLSLAYFLMGRPDHLSAYARIGETGVDEFSAYMLGYENGAVAQLASTLKGKASNQALITGSKGRIKIHEPFYCPQKMTIEILGELPDAEPGVAYRSPGFKEKVKYSVITQRLYKLVSGLNRALQSGSSFSCIFNGNGYQFEIAEVTQCLQRGETESKIMPLDESLDIMQTMDSFRKEWGLHYPQEE
jgi:predicted dehydrogenase